MSLTTTSQHPCRTGREACTLGFAAHPNWSRVWFESRIFGGTERVRSVAAAPAPRRAPSASSCAPKSARHPVTAARCARAATPSRSAAHHPAAASPDLALCPPPARHPPHRLAQSRCPPHAHTRRRGTSSVSARVDDCLGLGDPRIILSSHPLRPPRTLARRAPSVSAPPRPPRDNSPHPLVSPRLARSRSRSPSMRLGALAPRAARRPPRAPPHA